MALDDTLHKKHTNIEELWSTTTSPFSLQKLKQEYGFVSLDECKTNYDTQKIRKLLDIIVGEYTIINL